MHPPFNSGEKCFSIDWVEGGMVSLDVLCFYVQYALGTERKKCVCVNVCSLSFGIFGG